MTCLHIRSRHQSIVHLLVLRTSGSQLHLWCGSSSHTSRTKYLHRCRHGQAFPISCCCLRLVCLDLGEDRTNRQVIELATTVSHSDLLPPVLRIGDREG